MIRLSEDVWVGNSDDAYRPAGIKAVVNVAYDLLGVNGWPNMEYAQVGLVDGPGNKLSNYCAAIMTVLSVVKRNGNVLVYDHVGGRALAVACMYLNLVTGKYRPVTTGWARWMTWDERLGGVRTSAAKYEENVGADLTFELHPAHIAAFDRLPYGLLEVFL